MDPIRFSSFLSDFSYDSDDANFSMMNKKILVDDPMFLPILVAFEYKGTLQQRPRLILEGYAKLRRDYFFGEHMYSDEVFRRRFRMDRELFVRMADEVVEKNHYFQQKYDYAGRMSATTYQKINIVLRMLVYDLSADLVNENFRISVNSTLNCMKEFSRAIMRTFGEHYLREPNEDDIRRLNIINTRRGFPGMLGSIDCMHWRWKNCPTAWASQYQSGHKKDPSIVLQTVVSKDLCIWHAYFGASGCNNDINVLDESNLFDRLMEGDAPPFTYKINGTQYNM